LARRMREHLQGKGRYTSGKGEFKLIYVEGFEFKQDARRREKYLKSRSGRRYLETII